MSKHSDPFINRVTWSSVAFLYDDISDGVSSYRPLGSGTLVQTHGVKGVLTAGHVADKLLSSPWAAVHGKPSGGSRPRLMQFAPRSPGELFEVISLYDDVDAPDVAFVRLPPDVEADLAVNYTFFNLSKERDVSSVTLENCLVTGVASENVVVRDRQERLAVSTTLSCFYGFVSAGGDVPPTVRFDLQPIHNERVLRPSSYGGVSGAGVWVGAGDNPDGEVFLLGVASQQSAPDTDGNRIIRVEGPDLIYGALAPQVAQSWGRGA